MDYKPMSRHISIYKYQSHIMGKQEEADGGFQSGLRLLESGLR
jgi:hypothetical protein